MPCLPVRISTCWQWHREGRRRHDWESLRLFSEKGYKIREMGRDIYPQPGPSGPGFLFPSSFKPILAIFSELPKVYSPKSLPHILGYPGVQPDGRAILQARYLHPLLIPHRLRFYWCSHPFAVLALGLARRPSRAVDVYRCELIKGSVKKCTQR